MFVELPVEVDGAGNEEATEVLKLDDGAGFVEYYSGEIIFLFSNALALDDEYFQIDQNTMWYSSDGTPLSKADFEVGMFVEIKVRYLDEYTERIEEVRME